MFILVRFGSHFEVDAAIVSKTDGTLQGAHTMNRKINRTKMPFTKLCLCLYMLRLIASCLFANFGYLHSSVIRVWCGLMWRLVWRLCNRPLRDSAKTTLSEETETGLPLVAHVYGTRYFEPYIIVCIRTALDLHPLISALVRGQYTTLLSKLSAVHQTRRPSSHASMGK